MITQPYINFIQPDAGGNIKPVSEGKVYIGNKGLDPKIGGNPIYYRDNQGIEKEIPNPIYLNMTGVAVAGVNDSTIISPYAKKPISMLIEDKNGSEVYLKLVDVSEPVDSVELYEHTYYKWGSSSNGDNVAVPNELYKYGSGSNEVIVYTTQSGVTMGNSPDYDIFFKKGEPYTSIDRMKSDTSLEGGDFVRVINNGFFSDYAITTETTSIKLDNGLFAELQFDHAALDSAEEFTVGLVADYPSINEALYDLSRKKTAYVNPSTYNLNDIPIFKIRLLSGFKMQEQVLAQSIDLSRFVIVSDDAEVEILREFLTIEMSGRFPAFGARNNATLPIIGAKFVMKEGGEATNRDGVFVTNQSSVHVLPNCGVRNSGARGLHVSNGSICNARSSSFEQAKEAVLRVANGSHAAVRNSNFSNAGTNGMQISSGSTVDANTVNCSDAQNCGLFCQASFINAQDSNFDNCQKAEISNGYNGAVHVIQGANVFAAGSTANNSGRTAFECHDASLFLYDDVPQRTVDGKNAGISGIVNVAGTVIATRADLSNSASWGIDTVNASTLDAESAILTGCGDANTGPIRHRNGQGNYRAVQGDGAAKYGCLSDRGASISLEGASLKGHEQGLSAQGGSQVNAIGLDCSNCTSIGVSANNGSNVNFRSGIATRAGTPGGSDISIANGSTVVANGSSGTLSQSENTLTSNGVIYK